MARRVNYLLSQKEKFYKGEPTQELKDIFLALEQEGLNQTYSKEDKVRRLYNMAFGQINVEDYIKEEMPEGLEFGVKDFLEDHGLTFYPIAPTIYNAITGEYDKKYMEYYAQAVNRENTNEVIEKLNQDLRQELVTRATKLFTAENPNVGEEQMQLFNESKKIQEYYSKDYRTTIEEWANNIINLEDQRFNMKQVGRELLSQIIVSEDPIVHVNYVDGDYYPEVLKEKDCFKLQSPYARDNSESQMFGWFDYLNFGTVLNRHANSLSAEDIEYLNEWNTTYKSGFVINGEHGAYTGNKVEDAESTQNWLTFKDIEKGGTPNEFYFRQSTIYTLLPRLAYVLTYKSNNVTFQDVVDEDFKVTYKPKYEKGKPKSEFSLIEGEHLEPFYFNELYKAVSISPRGASSLHGDATGERIWIEVKKHDIQYSDSRYRYGVRIPVHGGSVSNFYNETYSIIEKLAPWQVMYNWLWNRNNQLLSTEVGKFLLLNQNMIPHESMGESWSKNNLLKFAQVGRDTSIAPLDASISHLGQSNANLGMGQVIDLTKTNEVLEKANLARLVKQEAYSLVGLTEAYLFGDISPRQSSTSVAQGMQRSSTQIQHIFTRLDEVVTNLRNTMLETAQYIASTNPTHQISLQQPDGTRTIFQANTKGFLLHKLGIFVKSSVEDADVLERVKLMALQDNTMGANALEKITMQTSKNIPELMYKLKDLALEKEIEAKRIQEQEQAAQQQAFEQQRAMQQEQMEYKRQLEEREHEKDILVAQIKALGFSNSTASEVTDEFSKLKELELKEQTLDDKREYQRMLNEHKEKQLAQKERKEQFRDILDEKIKIKELEQRDRELDIREHEARNTDERTDKL